MPPFADVKMSLDIMTVTCHLRAMKTGKYTMEELAELTGYSRRTIRYYVQEGLIAPPAGRGRGGFYYDSHLERLLWIKAHQEKGIGISAMTAMLCKEPPPEAMPEATAEAMPSREVMIRYEIASGIELNVSREREVSDPKKILEIIRIAKAIAHKEGER
jgi:DNA-binding transcriptional MerR regulator